MFTRAANNEHVFHFWAVMIFIYIIPVAVLLFSNGSIIARMKKTSKIVNEMGNPHHKQRYNTTKILLWVVFTFFIFHTPLPFIWAKNDSACYWLKPLGGLALMTNSSENFIIYCWVGRQFRTEFLKLFRCNKIWFNMTGNKTGPNMEICIIV